MTNPCEVVRYVGFEAREGVLWVRSISGSVVGQLEPQHRFTTDESMRVWAELPGGRIRAQPCEFKFRPVSELFVFDEEG